jgi:hypothetical protein
MPDDGVVTQANVATIATRAAVAGKQKWPRNQVVVTTGRCMPKEKAALVEKAMNMSSRSNHRKSALLSRPSS